jgi:hypothetical protein
MLASVPLRNCAITYTDSRGIRHSVDVTAESLFEAAVLGVQLLRKDGWIEDRLALAARLEIEVREPGTRHTVTLQQVERWLNGATGSPNDRVRRDRLKQMLRTSCA